jgi:hypothetical protein
MLDLLRAQVIRRSYGTVMRYRVRDREYLAIEVSKISGFPPKWRTMRHSDGVWDIISEHRIKSAACKAMEQYIKQRKEQSNGT